MKHLTKSGDICGSNSTPKKMDPIPIPSPRRVRSKRRFERERSNSLCRRISSSQAKMSGELLDDHSRFVAGSRIHHNPTAEHAIRLLEEAIGQFGKPDQILTDRGTQFCPARGGRSEFTEFCSGNDIEHIVTSVRRPSMIGKIEMFHKVYVCKSWVFPNHDGFIHYWNYGRPYQGIRYLHPADVYLHDRCG
jgi:transposase InsO family protein